ncbi:MAG: response regulator [Pseudomonadota bacterium]
MARLLILEDDIDLTDQWEEVLTAAGHELTITRNASEASARLTEQVYDLVIADIYVRQGGVLVPDGGVLLISRLRQMVNLNRPAWWQTVPILAVSGGSRIAGGFDPLRTARDLQATDWMRKPFTPKDLVFRVGTMLENAEAAAD